MTLGVTILSPVGIHQSADFNLSEPERDASGKWITMHENASKIISLHYERWTGLLTYCGMGLWQGKRTDEFVTDWLTNSPQGATFHEVIEIVRERGSRWIAEINRAYGTRRAHSFIVGGFDDGVTRYAIISNYQSLAGDIRPMTDALQVDAGSTGDVHVVITGIREAVSDEDRRLLKHLAETERNFEVIRHHMAEVNARAADSEAAKNGISRACLTASCDQTGQQWSRLYGDPPGQMIPRSVMGGTDLQKFLEQFLGANPNARIVQSASASTASTAAVATERIECDLRIRSGFDDSQRQPIANVEEFGAMNESCLDLRSINEDGCSVGSVRNAPDASPHACFRRGTGQIVDLGTLGGPHGYAHDINGRNEVVGGAQVTANVMHAFLWTEEAGMRDLGSLGGQTSIALAINDRGQIVGKSQREVGTDEHAFLWTSDTGLLDIFAAHNGFSRAIGINNDGVIIGWAGRGSAAEFGFVLFAGERVPIEIRMPSGRPFFISAISDAGLVIGEGDDPTGRRRPFSWRRQEGLRPLATDEPFHPTDVNRDGVIVGYVQGGRHPLIRPYIYTDSAGLVPLPFAEEHSTDAVAINGQGQILGAARGGTWKHIHPLIWRLSE